MTFDRTALVLATLLHASGSTHAQTGPGGPCIQETDNQRRLECYDRLFGVPGRVGQGSPPVQPRAVPIGGPAAATADDAGRPTVAAPPGGSVPPVPSVLASTWELGPDDTRGTFTVRTHRPNYLLPIHVTNRLTSPRSPTQPTPPAYAGYDYRHTEAKFQISLRAKMLEDAPLLGGDLWLAYTQVAFWQIYDSADSRPIRSTVYEPEALYILPLVERPWARLPGGWNWRMVQLGIGHQSNGENDPLSRSWNRAHIGTSLENGRFGLQARLEKRVFASGKDDNPDIAHYLGNTQLLATWISGPVAAALTWRTRLSAPERGSVQLDWTYPVRGDRPNGLRWYLQAFHGYGQSLLEYNERQTSVGAGLSLFQF